MKLDNQGSWNAVKFQTKLLVKRITAIHSVGVPSEKTSILEKFMNLLDNNFETLARLSNKTIGISKSKFYEPQNTAKINLSETKTSSCVLKSAFLFLFIWEKKLVILTIYPTLRLCVIFNVLSLVFPPMRVFSVFSVFSCRRSPASVSLFIFLCLNPFVVFRNNRNPERN